MGSVWMLMQFFNLDQDTTMFFMELNDNRIREICPRNSKGKEVLGNDLGQCVMFPHHRSHKKPFRAALYVSQLEAFKFVLFNS